MPANRQPQLLPIFALLMARVLAPGIVHAERPFQIVVVDRETGRGVPLVELRTVNQIRYVTDSQGVVAFDEPGLLGRKVYFDVKSHGYEFPKDGFGYRGVALDTKPGGEARLVLPRINLARRLYRVTGAGIYRDSLLTGTPVPAVEPLLNGQVLGQDSVLTTVYQGRIYWFWGDTNRPGYPLGNFHSPGATSELPGRGGLDPATGVRLSYFLGEDGFARPTCEMPGPGPTWITGLVVLRNREGRERMFANYAKITPPMETYQRGLVEWDPSRQRFQKKAEFPLDLATFPGEPPGGHTFQLEEGGVRYVYYCSPYPLVRAPADPESLGNPEAWETFTCLQPGTRAEERKLERASDGALQYAWKKRTGAVNPQQQAKLIKDGLLKDNEAPLNLRDVLTGKAVIAHGGSVAWNPHRRRWVMIAVEIFGSSLLGEVWYAEADTPLGPWVYARKIVTHEDYSFYNPRHHPMFDQQKGRLIYFEGTYTASFSGNKDPTPRYEYNQVMYQLDLDDPRLALPVPIYRTTAQGGLLELAARSGLGPEQGPHEIAFFAPDRPGIATVPAGKRGSEPAFYALPPDGPAPADTVPLFEFRRDSGSGPPSDYSVDETPRPGFTRTSRPLGRVWKNPGRLKVS
jgi:hypothetical protein